jgi:hypothetical protein
MITNLAPPMRSRLEIVRGTLAAGCAAAGRSPCLGVSDTASPAQLPSCAQQIQSHCDIVYRPAEAAVNGYLLYLFQF